MSKLSGWDKIKNLPADDPRRVHARTYAAENLRRKGGRKRTPEEQKVHSRKQALRKKYDITPEDYELFFNLQNGLCAICCRPEQARKSKGTEPKRLAVDHCHKTLNIRGLLCQECNTAIGLMDDCPLRLQLAINYLRAK